MTEMIEIHVVIPREVTILVPESLLEEFVEKAENEKLSEIITEALTEELKRLRFRRDLKRAQKADQE
jgi:cell shape-determining protein MreC